MALRTPSKLIAKKQYSNYMIRFVNHGNAIKYSSMEKNLNSKPMFVPVGYTSVGYMGIITGNDLVNYPQIYSGGQKTLIEKLPEGVRNQIIEDLKLHVKHHPLKEDTTITLFVYKMR
jgi:hypothetical protein